MEIKNFKQWLIENKFEDDELFIQSIKCYQVEAYKAAYLYSYLALINYIKEEILSYHGIPNPFLEKNIGKSDEEIEALWKKKIQALEHEDNWEEATLNFINEASTTNIFKLTDSVRNEFCQKKDLRNSSVHNKKRAISYTTVEDLWDFIKYVKPILVINGSVDMLISQFEKIIQFTEKKDYREKMDEVYQYYIQLQNNERQRVFVWIINYLEEYMQLWDYEPMECIDVFMEKIFQNQECDEYDWISNIKTAIYLWINVTPFLLKYSKVDLQEYAYSHVNDFLSILIPLGEDSKNCELLLQIFSYKKFNEWCRILTAIARSEYSFEISDELMDMIIDSEKIDDIFEQMEQHLYCYNTGWGQTKQTNTFDYCSFYEYSGDVNVILRMIMRGKLSNTKTEELVKRCKTILNLDYSTEYNQNNYSSMYDFFERDSAIYEWLKRT